MNSGPDRSEETEVPRKSPAWRHRLLDHHLIRAGAITYAFSGLTLLANLVSGMVTARALLPDGRGEVVAIGALSSNLGLFFALSCAQAISYRVARSPSDAPRLVSTWLVLLTPLAIVAIAVGWFAAPILFAAQQPETIDLARTFLFMIVFMQTTELTNGLLLGSRDFFAVSVLRFLRPFLVTVAYVVLWQLGLLDVISALVSAAVVTLVVQALAMRRAVRTSGGFGPIDLRLGFQTLWYGVKGHGAVMGNSLNQRLDLLILPAFVSASALGLYSIAANVSLIVSSLAGTIAAVVLPTAAQSFESRRLTIVKSLHAVLIVAAVGASLLFIFATPALGLVYGPDFRAAAPTLRILSVGTVLFAGASILVAGLYAANRPTLATTAQISGLLVTVVGLLVWLPAGGGTQAAAVVSSASYATVFLLSLFAYKRVSGVGWAAFLRLWSIFGLLRMRR